MKNEYYSFKYFSNVDYILNHKYPDIDAIYAATGWCVDWEVPIFITFTRRDK